jgi:hypothetical protein
MVSTRSGLETRIMTQGTAQNAGTSQEAPSANGLDVRQFESFAKLIMLDNGAYDGDKSKTEDFLQRVETILTMMTVFGLIEAMKVTCVIMARSVPVWQRQKFYIRIQNQHPIFTFECCYKYPFLSSKYSSLALAFRGTHPYYLSRSKRRKYEEITILL